jgi:NAD dependent epimerase/dehydratase family enzyme
MTGIYNVTSPNPVSQKVFMRELRRAMHVPIGLPATAWMVRIGAPLLLKSDPDLALYGRYVIPARLISEGYQFKFSNCAEALKNLL